LFRTNEEAFAKTKRKLLDDCDLWCVVSLPGNVFTAAGAGVKTNLLFFTKGKPTRKIWYYDLSNVKVGKKTPLTLAHFEAFFKLLPKRAESESSWTLDFSARRKAAAAQAAPLKTRSHEASRAASREAERAASLKKTRDRDEPAIEAALSASDALARESRELAAKAAEIEAAVFDLKAVNPNRKRIVDERSPEELIGLIEDKGREIAKVLEALRAAK
jgi:type I restriction enzyme M protein